MKSTFRLAGKFFRVLCFTIKNCLQNFLFPHRSICEVTEKKVFFAFFLCAHAPKVLRPQSDGTRRQHSQKQQFLVSLNYEHNKLPPRKFEQKQLRIVFLIRRAGWARGRTLLLRFLLCGWLAGWTWFLFNFVPFWALSLWSKSERNKISVKAWGMVVLLGHVLNRLSVNRDRFKSWNGTWKFKAGLEFNFKSLRNLRKQKTQAKQKIS